MTRARSTKPDSPPKPVQIPGGQRPSAQLVRNADIVGPHPAIGLAGAPPPRLLDKQ